ncbi:MAG TPA: protein BatD [Candidatus Avimuribaculum pullicola]|nr:protein BatD [Candidatus Avimuribaculum pullicola]
MNNILNKLLIVATLLVVGGLCALAQVSFTVDAPRQVIEGNKFTITYVLRNGEGSSFQEPKVEGTTKLFGPATSRSYSSQWVNGVSSSSTSEEYAITYRADKAGKYNVAAAKVQVDGKTYSTQPFTLEILPPDRTAQNGQGGVQIDNYDSQRAGKEVGADDLFIRINLSKSSAYEQEAVVCTIKLYTKYQVSQFMPTLQPSFNGFLIEELPITSALNNVERVNGQNYMVAELKKCILFPQQSGELEITSGNYDVTVVQYEAVRTLFGTMRQPVERQLSIKSNSQKINIKALPAPRPASFSGAVGKFSVETEIKPPVLKTYEASTLSYKVTGQGNIKYLKAPKIQFPAQFDVYDPQNNADAKPSGSTVSGTMTFEYTFIPQYVGKYEIPATEFTYFDPSAGKYVTLNTPKYDLSVAKGSGTAAQVPVDNNIEQKNTDILHIKTGDLGLQKEHVSFVAGWTYWLWYVLPTILLAAILVYYRKLLKERQNMALMRTKHANKLAKKRLKQAKAYMAANDSGKFYAELLNAIWGYLSDKLGIPVSELNKENIASVLASREVDDGTVTMLMELLDKCEFAQYAPELADSGIGETYNKAVEVMDKLETVKKK